MSAWLRRNRLLSLFTLLAIGGGVVLGIWWFGLRYAGPLPPDIPAAIADPEVRKAMTDARQKVLDQPRSVEAWGRLGLVYRANKANPEADICFKQAHVLNPIDPHWPYLIGLQNILNDPNNALPFLRQAWDLVQTADFNDYLARVGKSADLPEYRSAIRLRLAETLYLFEHWDEADSLFNAELQDDPTSARAHYGLGLSALRRDDLPAALAHFQAVAASPAMRQRVAPQLAMTYRRMGNLPEAIKYEEAGPYDAKDLNWLDPYVEEYARLEVGYSAELRAIAELEKKSRHEEVIWKLQDLIKKRGQPETYLRLAVKYSEARQPKSAEEVLRQLLKVAPEHVAAHQTLGENLFDQAERAWSNSRTRPAAEKQFEESISHLKFAEEGKPNNGSAYLYCGRALHFLGRNDEAVEQLRQAVRCLPERPEGYYFLGEALVDSNRDNDAMEFLEQSARLAKPGEHRPEELLKKVRERMKK